MADIELVIKIPDHLYKLLKDFPSDIFPSDSNEGTIENVLMKAVENGTPIPKRHGRLGDLDNILTSERPKGIADDVWKESHIYKLLSNAQTIIEADKADSGE